MCKFFDEEPDIIIADEEMSKAEWKNTKAKRVTITCDHCGAKKEMYESQYKTRTKGKIFCSKECYNESGYRKEQIKNWVSNKKGKPNENNRNAPKGYKPVLKCSFEEAQERLRKMLEENENIKAEGK